MYYSLSLPTTLSKNQWPVLVSNRQYNDYSVVLPLCVTFHVPGQQPVAILWSERALTLKVAIFTHGYNIKPDINVIFFKMIEPSLFLEGGGPGDLGEWWKK